MHCKKFWCKKRSFWVRYLDCSFRGVIFVPKEEKSLLKPIKEEILLHYSSNLGTFFTLCWSDFTNFLHFRCVFYSF